ncbi:ROK family protein [Bacillota bacterium Meth-B3]|nr:ROK family protein [Christensenellaceae bacterium]MEA5066912.1 ROK family protein [Eubacteriales bacterium]MEA5069571.1 ROK family protein [Christensenellaceae bacterium]
MRTAKHETMRSLNASVLLNCVRKQAPLTRHELQHRTGLSWGAVSSIVSEFLALGILTEMPIQNTHAGRTPVALDINARDHLCVGLDIHAQGLHCVVTDMRARTLYTTREGVRLPSRQGVLDQAVSMAEEAIERVGVEKSRYIGAGLSVQGAVDAERGVSLHSPHLPDWRNVPLTELIGGRLGLPATLSHDTNAVMMAELWSGRASGARNLVFVRLDMGIGMAVVIDDRLYTGASGIAGELGHMVINPGGPRCTCGNYGCLEAYASGRSILQRVREGINTGCCALKLTGRYDRDLDLVAEAADAGSAFERDLFETMGMYLGVGISNYVIMMNPEMVVIGGDLARHSRLYLDRVNAVLKRNVWTGGPIDVVISDLNPDAAAIGATLLLVQQALGGHIPHSLGDLFRSLAQ